MTDRCWKRYASTAAEPIPMSVARAVNCSLAGSCDPVRSDIAARNVTDLSAKIGALRCIASPKHAATMMTSHTVASRSAVCMCSATPGIGPAGIPIVRETPHTAIMEALPVTPTSSARALGERTIHTAQTA